MAANLRLLLEKCSNEKGPIAELLKALTEKVIELDDKQTRAGRVSRDAARNALGG